jgi:hypothetical protein
VTELLEHYRLNAEKCLQLAQNFQEPEAKHALLFMANAWLMLAAQREKNIETAPAHQTQSPVNEPPPPPDQPPAPPPIDEPPKPPMKEPPPAKEPPPMRLNADRP